MKLYYSTYLMDLKSILGANLKVLRRYFRYESLFFMFWFIEIVFTPTIITLSDSRGNSTVRFLTQNGSIELESILMLLNLRVFFIRILASLLSLIYGLAIASNWALYFDAYLDTHSSVAGSVNSFKSILYSSSSSSFSDTY